MTKTKINFKNECCCFPYEYDLNVTGGTLGQSNWVVTFGDTNNPDYTPPADPIFSHANQSPTDLQWITILDTLFPNKCVGDFVSVNGEEVGTVQKYGLHRNVVPAGAVGGIEVVSIPFYEGDPIDWTAAQTINPTLWSYPGDAQGDVGPIISYTNQNEYVVYVSINLRMACNIDFNASSNPMTSVGNKFIIEGALGIDSDLPEVNNTPFYFFSLMAEKMSFPNSGGTQQRGRFSQNVVSMVEVPASQTVNWQPKAHLYQASNNVANDRNVRVDLTHDHGFMRISAKKV